MQIRAKAIDLTMFYKLIGPLTDSAICRGHNFEKQHLDGIPSCTNKRINTSVEKKEDLKDVGKIKKSFPTCIFYKTGLSKS